MKAVHCEAWGTEKAGEHLVIKPPVGTIRGTLPQDFKVQCMSTYLEPK